MDDALFVRRFETFRDLPCDRQCLVQRERPACDALGQVFTLYEFHHERGNAPACVELGHLHAQGEGVERDARKAVELFTKACKLGLDEGCLLASRSGDILPPRD